MGGQYPSLSPVGAVGPTRAARILQPGVVLVAVVLLLFCCVIGTSIGAAAFGQSGEDGLSSSVSASQALILIASGFSFVYIFLHGIAAYRNEPVGASRPPERQLHAGCFILARLGLVLWAICIIASAVVVGKPDQCVAGSKECRLYILDLVVSNLAFITTGILLTALEACQYPFEIPEQFTTGITCRVSSFGDDLYERTISSSESLSSADTRNLEKSRPVLEQPSRRSSSPMRSMPGEYPVEVDVERRLTPLLPMLPALPVLCSREWEANWRYRDGENKEIERVDSAISLGSETSMLSGYSSDSNPSLSKRKTRLREVTPSSNISNQSRRSPLSRMRSVEFPDVVVQPQMRFMPSSIPPPQSWSSTQAWPGPITKVPRAANPNALQRRPYLTDAQPPHRRPASPQAPVNRKPLPIPRRRTVDMRVPGSFVNYRMSMDDAQKLDEHAKKIDAEFASIAEREQKKRPVRLPSGPFEQPYSPNSLESRTRYHEQRQSFRPYRLNEPNQYWEEEPIQVRRASRTNNMEPVRRPSLGALPSDTSGVFEENQGRRVAGGNTRNIHPRPGQPSVCIY